MVCFNCSGAHGAGDQTCPVRERPVQVTSVRLQQRVSYAEEIKNVEEDRSRVKGS